MKTALAALIALGATAFAVGEDFVPPAAYPMDRYEAGWQKNPFTLKTAPVAMQKESFAKDLALANWSGAGTDTIVSVVNIKTREYTRLKNSEAAPNGMFVKSTHLEDKRADTYVELELAGETAVVKYDEAFLKQMAGKGAAPPGQPNVAANLKLPVANGNQPPGAPMPGAQNNRPLPPTPTPGARTTAPGGNNGYPGNISPNVQFPNIPTPQRRRINTGPIPGSGQR